MKIRRLALFATVIVTVVAAPERARRQHAGRPPTPVCHTSSTRIAGIDWATINDTFWRAEHPLSDGSGNPPPSWGNPFQGGTLVFINPGTARFDSPAGTVTFKRTSRKHSPLICS